MSVIEKWFRLNAHITCASSVQFLHTVKSDREFYDKISSIENFMTGIAMHCPLRAQSMLASAILNLFSDISPLQKNVLEMLIDEASDAGKLKAIQLTGRGDLNRIIRYLVNWRTGRADHRVARRIYPLLNRQRRKENVMRELKKVLPYEEWIDGVKIQIQKASPQPPVALR
jgi:hypothetical protein